MEAKSILILGGGLQGVSSALALASHGYRPTIIDQSTDILTQASLRNEGKIHLGFVYAKDLDFKTPKLMLQASLGFAPLIDSWLEHPLNWSELTSRAFDYAILKDSMCSVEQLQQAYENLQNEYVEILLQQKRLHYLGERPNRIWEAGKDNSRQALFHPEKTSCVVQTVERSLALPEFCSKLRSAVESSSAISTLLGHRVESIQRTASGFRVSGITCEGVSWQKEAEIIVNCLWEGRLAIDAQLGIEPKKDFVYRLKYRMLGELPAKLRKLASVTFVLGRFGDIVVTPNSKTYFSWYPECMKGWSQQLSAPQQWQAACSGAVETSTAKDISKKSLRALGQLIPGVEDSTIATVDAGVIFSWGNSDIDDPKSELHRRDEIGIHESDGYFSINTGKLTTAPLFAAELVQRFSSQLTDSEKMVGNLGRS